MRAYSVLSAISNSYPQLKGTSPTRYSPVRHSRIGASTNLAVRLACLRRAASVRSEPGSNSPWLFLGPKPKIFIIHLTWPILISYELIRCKFIKNLPKTLVIFSKLTEPYSFFLSFPFLSTPLTFGQLPKFFFSRRRLLFLLCKKQKNLSFTTKPCGLLCYSVALSCDGEIEYILNSKTCQQKFKFILKKMQKFAFFFIFLTNFIFFRFVKDFL